MNEEPPAEPEVLAVRFNGILFGCGLLLATALFAGVLYVFAEVWVIPGVLVAGFGLPALLMIGASFDTRPLLVVEPEGVRLACAGNILLGYDEIEVWAEQIKSKNSVYWTFSLQGRPRTYLDISWWTWLRFVRVNTLTGGDLLLDSRLIDARPQALAALIQERIDRAPADISRYTRSLDA